MGSLLQSAAWWCFVPSPMSPKEFVRAIAEMGYAAVDLPPQEHWSMIKEQGLAISAVGGHLSLTAGLNQRELHDGIVAEIEASLRLAEAWGIPNLLCFSGNRNGLNDAEGAEITAEGLARVAPAAEAAGVTLVLELLNSKVDHPDYQCDHTAWGVQVCKMVNSPRVKLLYDIYHMQIMEGDIIRTIQTGHPYFGHYHTAGNPGRHELDDNQELNYPAIVRAIAATGYTGYVAHEFLPTGDPAQGLKAAFDLTEAALRQE